MSVLNNRRINNSTILRRKNDQIFSEIEDEVILLNVASGEYINLNEVGSFIWNQLKDATAYEHLIDLLLNNFKVVRTKCEKETLPFLEEMLTDQIIYIVNEELSK